MLTTIQNSGSNTRTTGKTIMAASTSKQQQQQQQAAISTPVKSTTTTITSDPGILCFHHCNVKVFCFTLPHICPQCKMELDTSLNGSTSAAAAAAIPRKAGAGAVAASRKLRKTKTNQKHQQHEQNDINNKKTNKQHKMNNNGGSSSSSIKINNVARISKVATIAPNDNDNQKCNGFDELVRAGVTKHNNNHDNTAVHTTNSDSNINENDCDINDNNADDDDDDNINESSTTSSHSSDEDDVENNLITKLALASSNSISHSRLLPFRLPYPFVRASQYPCAIILRPTTGDFLNDYNNTTDLHIAVTTSTGHVVEFDRHGLRRHRTDNMSEWWQCLLVGDVPEPWYDYWDQVLFEVCQQQPHKWTVGHYHEDKHNCYTFVLTFLQALTYDKLSEAAASKTTFCEKYIVPRTTTAGKYISLYRKLRDAGIYVHPHHHHQQHVNQSKLRSRGAGHQKQEQKHFSKSNLSNQQQQQISVAKTTVTSNNSAVARNKSGIGVIQHQQQQQKYHHNHHSIISRPHPTLCTIEE